MNKQAEESAVVIGSGAGFWGDSQIAMPQLLGHPGLQYIVFDYLAETTMSILQRARMRNPEMGYATDFVTTAVTPHLGTLMSRGIRLISNAGGLNPEGCRQAILAEAEKQGLKPKIVVVLGDDVSALSEQFKPFAQGADGEDAQETNRKRNTQAVDLPESMLSANAYLGAEPIVRALESDADIIIVGRCVDSALVAAIAIHEFGWSYQDYNKIAQASLAGHLLECGPQATGGLYTDWETIPSWETIGYPIACIQPDGEFLLTKADNTGGLVTPAVVTEQLLYEIGDPAAYQLPDVVCDFRAVQITDVGSSQVLVRGARGRVPGPDYKVTVTYQDGYQLVIMMAIRGQRAQAKAIRTAETLLRRTQTLMKQKGYENYSDSRIELLGAESHYGPHKRIVESREVVLRLAVKHPVREALAYLQRESASAGISMGPGTRSHFGGRSRIQSVIGTKSYFLPKTAVEIYLSEDITSPARQLQLFFEHSPQKSTEQKVKGIEESALSLRFPRDQIKVPLSVIAHARSGDKGNDANIGVVARSTDLYPVLLRELTEEVVAEYFAHLLEGTVSRYTLPGTCAVNFLLTDSLGGGGASSLSSDPLGKAYAQMLLDLEINCPVELLKK